MDQSNRKRKGGFVKAKLIPFYRVSKPSSTSNSSTTTTKQSSMQYISSKVKPPTYSVGYLVQNHSDYHVISTTPAQASPKQKITFIVPPSSHADHHYHQKITKQQHDYNLAGDEMVDMKAATYISSVQERFKLEHINS